MLRPKNRSIVALDVNDKARAAALAHELAPFVWGFKVGLEQITAGIAWDIVESILNVGGNVFWDGKFDDIPNTVAAACSEATRLGVSMLNVHCQSGAEAMEAAADAVRNAHATYGVSEQKPILLGVTVLTSLGHRDLVRLGTLQPMESGRIDDGHYEIEERVVRLALLAKESGLDGVVASPKEIRAIRRACGDQFLIVTPGVRPVGVAHGDQKRVMTPGEAIKEGSDYLVIGRPILRPESGTPAEAARRIAEEIAAAF